MVLELFIGAACILEILRVIFLAGEMRQLAIERAENPHTWVAYTILLWISIELLVVYLWYKQYGYNLTLVAGVILAILIARLNFYFLKRNLENRERENLEDKIDQIGTPNDSPID